MGTDGSIGYRVTPLGAGEVGSRTLRIWKAKPDYTDITIDGTVWLGYFNGTDYDICRVNYCEDILTRTWATGAWDDRYTLLPFCGYTTTTTEELVTTTTGEITTTTTAIPFFMMKFDSLANADLTVGGDATDVADWNTFFDLPANGTPFDNIQIVGNTPTEITLYGGGNMTLSAYLFGDNDATGTSLLEVEDNGVTVACEDGVFSDINGGSGCYGVTSIILPSLNINGTKEVFADCEVLVVLNIDFDSIITLGADSFDYCPALTSLTFNNCTQIGNQCFLYCWGLTTLNLPSLVTMVGQQNIRNCISLTTISLPSCSTVGYVSMWECTSLITISLPVCTNLGGSVIDDGVWEDISGNTITLTVPSALMTCNAGQPDGDIQYLDANNTLTIIQV